MLTGVEGPVDAGTKPPTASEVCHRRHYKGASNTYTSLYLVASTKGSAAGKTILVRDETGGGNQGPTDATFITWRRRPAVRLVLMHMATDTGVTSRLERILSLENETPVTLHEATLSPTY
jgi:hypothetical protein